MPEQILHGLEILAQLLEIVGASLLVIGFVASTIIYARQNLQLGTLSALANYRTSLGRVILVGLEVLVAATIIKTITVDPSVESLGLLALMIVIRTILSWTTVLETSGHWPWQKAPGLKTDLKPEH
jgi:uncharacterized membrane protein